MTDQAPPRDAADVRAEDDATNAPRFPVVGIGASAGGLDALEQLFANVPADCGMAFVVVTHTQPGRQNLLPQILGRQTTMTVTELTEPTPLEPNHVYVAPGGKYVEVHEGTLSLTDIPEQAPRAMPVDYFFRSLAADRQQYAIGIVLSGTGSDGTIGVRELKAGAGLAIAQEEASARYPSMPSSAAATELVDYVLPPHEIPDRLIEYVQHAFGRTSRPFAGGDHGDAEDLQRIFLLLRRHSGHDFSSYKPSTLRRRIERRMNVHHVTTPHEYARFLQANSGELDALFHELLIGVTSFFRDAEAFEALERAIPALIADRPNGYAIRAWVAGCSTGEEAYSIAMVIRECMDRLQKHHPVQVFATDLDGAAIEIARMGVYPESVAAYLSPERIDRFFTREDGSYRIRKDLRDMVVFAPHNVTSDPPFTRIDLLSCRNLMIYLNADLQARLVPLFHYALRKGGLLLLGSSESVGSYAHLFEPVDKKWKLFARREVAVPGYTTDFTAPSADGRRVTRVGVVGARPSEPALSNVADRALFHHLVPPSVIAHETGEIVHIHGRTGEFLELTPGVVTSVNLLAMAREGLALDLAGVMREAAAAEDGAEVVRTAVRVRANGHWILVDLRAKKLTEPEPLRGLVLVAFERSRLPEATPAGDSDGATSRLAELERELQHGKEVHQGVIEELEAANEELKSTNEELQSTNEELQSTNEELETSKEEMQSLNEELQTVNAEPQDKLDELSRINDDMKNLLNSTDIATVFLDNELKIKRYTEQAKRVIPLIPADVGRPVRDLVSRLRYDAFVEDADEVLRTLVFKETEVQSADGNWYLARIMPYRTTDNVIDGLVITFIDITRIKGLQQQSGALLAALASSPTAVFALDRDLRYTWAATPVFGVAPSALTGKRARDVLAADVAAEVEAIPKRVLASGESARERLTVQIDGARRTYDAYFEPIKDRAGAVAGLSGVITALDRP